MPTDPILSDEPVREWAKLIDLPLGHAQFLVVHIAEIEKELESKSSEDVAAWRAEQEEHLSTNVAMSLDEDKKAKVERLLMVGSHTPFGGALARSEARHSAHLWFTIATECP